MKYSINKSGQLVIEAKVDSKCIKRSRLKDGSEVVLFQGTHQRKNHFLVSYRFPDGEGNMIAQNWNHFSLRGEAEAAFSNLESLHRKAWA